MNFSEGKKSYHSVNEILTHYHIWCDPYIGPGKCAMKIISCACIKYNFLMDLPLDPSLVPKYQPIYYSVTEYKYYPILGKHNDWVIMDWKYETKKITIMRDVWVFITWTWIHIEWK